MSRVRPARPSLTARRPPPVLVVRARWSSRDHVAAVAWAPDGAHLVAADLSGAVTVLDMTGHARELARHDGAASDVSWSADGAEIASSGEDGVVRRRSPAGAPGPDLVLAGWADRCAHAPDGRLLAAAAGRRLVVADRGGGVRLDTSEHRSTVADLAWSPDGTRVATCAYGGVTVWDPAAVEPARRLEWTGSSLALRWSPDGLRIATGDQDATVHYWIVADGRDLMMSGYPTKVEALAWAADGRFLATGGGDAVTLWNCAGAGPAGRRPDVLDGDAGLVTAVAAPGRGPGLAAGTEAGAVLLWRIGGADPEPALATAGAAVSALAFSPDGTALAVGSAEGVLILGAAV